MITYFWFAFKGILSAGDEHQSVISVKSANSILVNIANSIHSHSPKCADSYSGFGLLFKDASSIIDLFISKNIIPKLIDFLSYNDKYLNY